MNLIGNREYNNIQVKKDGTGFINADTHIIPIHDTLLKTGLTFVDPMGVTPISGWPLYYVFPNMLYNTRYHLDATMLEVDLGIADAYMEIPQGLQIGSIDKYHSASYTLNLGNIQVSWDLGIPKCTTKIEENSNIQIFDNLAVVQYPSYYEVDNGTALTDPTVAAISNHHIVKYAALDRGYGKMKHGWFKVDVSGIWSFSVDGLDVVEIVIDDGVVASKYTNSGLAGTDVLWGNINLAIGWHHLFAYCSDNSTVGQPVIRFKRPGDSIFSNFATDLSDGIVWNRSRVFPKEVKFRLNSGNITTNVIYDDSNQSTLTVPKTDIVSGNLSISFNTIPRYRPYYFNNWRETQLTTHTSPDSLPPVFRNMRMIMEFDPLSELLCYSEHSIFDDYSPRFAVSYTGASDWYIWTGSAFQTADVASVTKLLTNGNDLYTLNNIPSTDWTTFLPSIGKKYCRLLFTGAPPLATTYNRKVFQNMSTAEYILSTISHVTGKLNMERRQI